MTKFLKLVMTGTIVLGASSAMALDGELGIQGESPGTIGTECYVYNADKSLVIGVVLDAYNENILDEDENIIGNTAVMKCALPKPEKKPRHEKPTTTEDQVSYIGDGIEICISPKMITEKIDEVKDDGGNIITEEVDAILENYASTTIWKNLVSASGEVSLVCKHLQTASENQPPVAIAGTEQTISICDALILNGSESYDRDGDIISYEWSLSDGTAIGQGKTLVLPMTDRTSGINMFTLTVTDDQGGTDTDTVAVTINGADSDYDFSYIITNPFTAPLVPELTTYTQNAVLDSEGIYRYWKPIVGGADIASTNPAIIEFTFNFPGVVQNAYLYTRVDSFHWAYSQGYTYLYGSSNGMTWETLVDNPPPAYGEWSGGYQNGFVPNSMLGTNDIVVKAELYSYGSHAHYGDSMTNTAQFLRYGIDNPDYKTFKLNVCYE